MILVSLLILLVLIAINGVLAASELSVVSARPARLQARADQGSRGAGVALDLAAAPDRFLSTVQIGIPWSAFWLARLVARRSRSRSPAYCRRCR